MTCLHLSVLYLLACVVSLTAVRYGDYSVAHMPQYHDQDEESDLAPRHDEYSDRSPDAPARLDYKYEEAPHGKSDDIPVKDIADERLWDNPIKKKRKPLILHSEPNRDLDKYTLYGTEPELKPDKRFLYRSKFRKRNFVKQSDSQRHLKHRNSVDESDDNESGENNSGYVHKEDVLRAEGDSVDAGEISNFRYRSTTQRKPRRKPRDRALHQPEWTQNNNIVKLEQEEVDARLDRDNFEIKNTRRYDGVVNRDGMNTKSKINYDYDEYYDMKRVQHMKNRLPTLLRQTTVITMDVKSTTYSGHWLNRRDDSPAEHSISEPIVTEATSTITNATQTSTAKPTTSDNKSLVGNSTDLSFAEKSRLSILKKAQRKENLRNVTSSTKPPVLMQVTRKMQTMVMVEPRSPETGLRAREVWEDSSERLQRARQLMRHKLVANARNIHELTDNWDDMICDYIEVSLLDINSASCIKIYRYVIVLLFLLPYVLFI